MCARQPCLSQLWPHAACAVIDPCHRLLCALLDATQAWSLLSQRTSLFGRVLAERANADKQNI